MSSRDGSVTYIDSAQGSIEVINESGLELDGRSVMEHLVGQHPEVAALVRWTSTTQGGGWPSGGGGTRTGNPFDRDRYVTPTAIFDVFRVARDAAENDDVVSGVADTTESLAFNRMSFLTEDTDEEDVWNQLAANLDLDSRLREMWRELFIYSQFYGVVWWGRASFTVRGKTPQGNAKRKTFPNLQVPLGLTLLDPLKIVPVGGLLFNQERLAYIADPMELDVLEAAAENDPKADPFARQLIVERYRPGRWEMQELVAAGVSTANLFLLNPANAFRHSATRPQYQRWASVRMKSVFEVLDLKEQLRASDRAHLIGGTNFIVLVKKGTDQFPAKPQEVRNLKAQVQTVARVPILVGDHRLSVEIIEAKQDHVLKPERYNGLNAAITARLYQMFLTGNYAAGASGDDSIKLAKVVARGMESRRRQLRRQIEAQIIRPTVARNDELSTEPRMRFHPARIELAFDPAVVQFLIDARDRGDISRETYLGEIEVDQETEAILRRREKEHYDDVFVPTNVPFTANPGAGGPADPRTAGRNKGGNRNGGGAAPGSGQGQPPRRGKPATKPGRGRPAAAVDVLEQDEGTEGGEEEDEP